MQSEQTIELKESKSQTGGVRSVTELMVTGMTCGNCARHVTNAIQGVTGVHSATVNLEAGRATVRWQNAEGENVPAVLEAITAEGFGAKPLEVEDHAHGGEKLAGWRLNLWVGVLGTLPLMIGEWVFDLGMAAWFRWASFGLAATVQVFGGAPFYRGAWSQLKVGASNMDTLVALGSTTAFAYRPGPC